MNDDRELLDFKTQINLVDDTIDCGYEIDGRKSSRGSFALRRESDDDKISVWVNSSDGHWMYKSYRHGDTGSILDFVNRRQTNNLGEKRKLLRPWTNRPAIKVTAKPDSVIKDRKTVEFAWDAMTPIDRTEGAYLRERGLHPEVWASPRFAPMIRQDRGYYRNIAFVHYDRKGICGYEVRNRGFSRFAKGGTKGIWCSTNVTTATTVSIEESALDCLSHAQWMQTGAEVAYVSIAGQLAGDQLDLLRWVLDRRENIKSVEVGTDNDDAGREMADRLMAILPDRVQSLRVIPPTGKDWNDTLRAGTGTVP